MRRRASSLMLLLVLSLGPLPRPVAAPEEAANPGPPQPAPAPQPVLAGTVISEKNEEPIAGALVEVYPWLDPDAARARRLAGELVPAPLGAATTDAAGAFRVPVAPQQRVVIAVSAAGHARARYRGAFLTGASGDTRDVGRLALAAGRSISGKVTDASGKPVPGATVIALSRPAGRAPQAGRLARRFAAMGSAPSFPVTAVAGADGAFALHFVSEDPVTLRAHASGLAPAVKRDVRGSEGIVLSMEQGHALSGTVVAPDGITPAAGAWIVAGPEGEEGLDGLARADAKGAFTLRNLRPGSTGLIATVATVIAGASDDLPTSAHWAPSAAFNAKIPLAGGAAEPKLRLRPGGALTIRTIDAETREPVAGSLLVLDEPGDAQPRPATTGPSGSATYTGVSAGSVAASGDAADYLTEEAATVDLAAGENRALSIPLRRAAALAGTVRDAAGRPIAGATVSVAGPPPFASPIPMAVYFPIGVAPAGTDAAGGFRLEKLPPRTDLQVTVSFEGYVPWEIAGLKLRPGERREGLEVLLDLGAIVAGRLLDQEGSPIEGAAVTAEKQREGSGGDMVMMVAGNRRMGAGGPLSRDTTPAVASDETGAFRVGGLKSGVWTLRIKAKGFAPREIGGLKLEETGKGLDAGDIVMEPGVVLRGRIASAQGAAVPFARGTLRERLAPLSEFTAGPDGSFVTEDMAPGDTFDLNVQAEGYATFEKSGLTVPAEDMSIVMVPSSTIRGEVIDEETREPIEDFSIAVSRTRAVGGGGMQFNMLMAGPERQFQTDDGTFAIDGVDPGTITVRANAPGHKETRLDDIKVPEGADLDGIRITMPRAASVSGTVHDDRGRPLPNVEVARKQATQGMMVMRAGSGGGTTTDGDGKFILSGLERGPMTLSFTHPEFETASADVNTTSDVDNLKVTMSRGTDLTGIVIHEDDGSPVAGAAVTAVAAGASRMGQAVTAKTAPDGSFTLEALSAGRYTVRAEAKGLQPATADDVVVAAGVQPALVELKVGGGVTLTGTITGIDPEDLPRFSVSSVRPGGGFGVTAAVDASGKFEMGGLPPGSMTLIARSGILGGRSMTRTVEIPEGAVTFETSIDFPRGSVVEGTVTRGGEPVDGASVIFIHATSRASQTVRTDQAGNYTASDVEDGQYDVTVLHFRSGTTHTTSVAVGGDKRFDIELPLARIAGTVTDQTTGKAIDGAQIAIRKLDGEATSSRMGMLLQRGASTDATGAYAIDGLDTGTYSLTASRPGYGYETQQASIIPGIDPPEISFVLGPTEGLSFTAIDGATGMPLRSLTGLVLTGGGDPLSPGGTGSSPILSGRWSADSSGVFHLDSLQPGNYRMVLGGEGLATKTFHDVEVPASGALFTLERGGTLELRAGSLQDGQTAMAALVDEKGRALHFSTFFPEPGFRLRGGEPTVLADLPPGAWRVRVAWPDGRVDETPATIAPGQVLRISLP